MKVRNILSAKPEPDIQHSCGSFMNNIKIEKPFGGNFYLRLYPCIILRPELSFLIPPLKYVRFTRITTPKIHSSDTIFFCYIFKANRIRGNIICKPAFKQNQKSRQLKIIYVKKTLPHKTSISDSLPYAYVSYKNL